MKILFVGRFYPYSWGEMPTEFYIANEFEVCGQQVIRVNIDDMFSSSKIVRLVISASKSCDLILFAAGIINLSLVDFKQICDSVSILKVLYTNDWIFLDKDREKKYLERFSFVDLLITTDTVDYSQYKVKKFYRVPMGCISSYIENIPESREFINDLVFVGNLYSEKRKSLINNIKSYFSNLVVYGYNTKLGTIYGKDLQRVLLYSKISIGDSCILNVPGYWSSRLYIHLGFGAFLLFPYIPGIELEFKNKEHLVWYNSFEELIDLIHYYLLNDSERERIRKQGFLFTQRNCNWNIRVREFINIFQNCL